MIISEGIFVSPSLHSTAELFPNDGNDRESAAYFCDRKSETHELVSLLTNGNHTAFMRFTISLCQRKRPSFGYRTLKLLFFDKLLSFLFGRLRNSSYLCISKFDK